MHRNKRYIKVGLTAFCVAAALLLFYDMLFGNRVLPKLVAQVIGASKPVLYGAFMAYLLSPVINFLERTLFSSRVEQARARGKLCAPGVRVISVLITWTLVLAVLYLLISFLLPELYNSTKLLASNVENYYNTVMDWVERLFERFPDVEPWVSARMQDAYNKVADWMKNDAMKDVLSVARTVGGGVWSLVAALKDILIGVIVSVYFLMTKEGCAAQAKRITYSVFPLKNVPWILRGAGKADHIFSGFVRGKLLDSIIIGVLCFIGCSLLKFPYTPLVSVFVGITNIIPFFGPFLGAIPSAFLILLVSPLKCLYFLVFVLALQQLDGNVIGPKILGDQTGLSSLWVIVAILLGGSFFGIAGMFFGVPVLACIYSGVNFLIRWRLREQGLPEEIDDYAGEGARQLKGTSEPASRKGAEKK